MKAVLDRYLKEHTFYPALYQDLISNDTGIIVCIPCYNEPFVASTLSSLANCKKPEGGVTVFLLINQPINCDTSIDQINQKCFDVTLKWRAENDTFLQVLPVRLEFDNMKHAGVGLARKVAMDEAVRQFYFFKKEGIIVCLDADCQVDSNYFVEIERFFLANPKVGAASINFEHSIEYLPEPLYTSILNYELHLRYYRHAQRFACYPHAFYTIGSCMALRVTAYAAYGGMNRRQAGEDFYFLSKFMEAGKMGVINTTTVYPSARMSDRVPFGTGRIVESEDQAQFMTYSFGIFKDIKIFLDIMEKVGWSRDYGKILAEIPQEIASYLESQNFANRLDNIRSNTSSRDAFIKRFYRWLNPLKFLKLVHHLRDEKYGKEEVGLQSFELLRSLGSETENSKLVMLYLFRKLDKEKIK